MCSDHILRDYFFFQAEDRIRDGHVTGVQTCALPILGSKTINAVMSTEREDLRRTVQIRLQEYLDQYSTGLLVSAVVLDSTAAPAAVRDAFQDVTRAREDEDRFKKEAEAYANGVIPEARGRAQRLREEAEAYRAEIVDRARGEAQRFGKLLTEYERAPEVTRQRLYLETMEAVLGNSSKVFLGSQRNNSMMYLHFDKIIQTLLGSLTHLCIDM